MANALAESPSVRISVQSLLLADPAKLASSNLVIPTSLDFFEPPFLLSSAFCLNLAQDKILSIIPLFSTFLRNLSSNTAVEPNAEAFVVRFSLV